MLLKWTAPRIYVFIRTFFTKVAITNDIFLCFAHPKIKKKNSNYLQNSSLSDRALKADENRSLYSKLFINIPGKTVFCQVRTIPFKILIEEFWLSVLFDQYAIHYNSWMLIIIFHTRKLICISKDESGFDILKAGLELVAQFVFRK